MANTTTKGRKSPPKTEKPKVTAPDAEQAISVDDVNAEVIVEEPAVKEVETAPTEESSVRYKAHRELDPSTYVTVRNGFNGTLVYKSKRTGERYIWSEFGDEQEMELSELKAARNSYKAFFVNNWFLFDDPEVISWLGVTGYYKHALNAKSFDKLFDKSPDEIKAIVSEMPSGQKKTLVFRAKQLIDEGRIDSIKVITALEESLAVALIER